MSVKVWNCQTLILSRAYSSWHWPSAAFSLMSLLLLFLNPFLTLSVPPSGRQVVYSIAHLRTSHFLIRLLCCQSVLRIWFRLRWGNSGKQHPSHLPAGWQGSHHQRASPSKALKNYSTSFLKRLSLSKGKELLPRIKENARDFLDNAVCELWKYIFKLFLSSVKSKETSWLWNVPSNG